MTRQSIPIQSIRLFSIIIILFLINYINCHYYYQDFIDNDHRNGHDLIFLPTHRILIRENETKIIHDLRIPRQISRNSNRNRNRNGNRGGGNSRNNNDNNIQSVQCRTSNGFPGVCSPRGLCHSLYGDVRYYEQESCRTSVNGARVVGVCCPVDASFSPNPRARVPYRIRIPRSNAQPIRISRRQILQAIRQADADVARYLVLEEVFTGELGQVQVAFTPAHFLQMMFGPPDQNQQLSNLYGFRALQLTRALGENLQLSPLELRDGLSLVTMHGTPYEQYCLQQPKCDRNYPYRTIDGSCNNLNNPLWGQSLTQFNRLLPPEYSDGISELRISITGRPLPPPRALSTQIFDTSDNRNARSSNRWNVMFMQWGQFLDHDITLGSSTRASTGEGLLCCNRTNAQGPLIHPACRPIYLPIDDPFYSRHNRRCNNFVRNAVGPKTSCGLGYREQSNVVTSFIDASMIYGNDFNRSRLVRSFRNGLLKTQQINGKEWLPFDTMNNSLACSIRNRQGNNRCVFSGDVRVNQQFGIVALQLLFLREHNRLARSLAQMNTDWDDEAIYQEARRIVSAQIQHITFNEFLPEALGRSVIRHFDLTLQPSGYCLAYDPDLNPSILNEFGAAAFRWHSMVQKSYDLLDSNKRVRQSYSMHEIFNNPTFLYSRDSLDQAIRGLLVNPTDRFDRVFTEDVKNLLFAQTNSNNQRVGIDLVSINIQRGRDHGMPTYNQIRRVCNLPAVEDFSRLQSLLANRDDVQRLQRLYAHVDDIDFWVAGNLERTMDEGMLGPTFSCIVGEQFRRLKYGDRFWYENGQMKHSFSEDQLRELRKVTLAGIICENADNINRVQPLAMNIISEQNPELDCSSIPKMNLSPWYNHKLNEPNRRTLNEYNHNYNHGLKQGLESEIIKTIHKDNNDQRYSNNYQQQQQRSNVRSNNNRRPSQRLRQTDNGYRQRGAPKQYQRDNTNIRKKYARLSDDDQNNIIITRKIIKVAPNYYYENHPRGQANHYHHSIPYPFNTVVKYTDNDW